MTKPYLNLPPGETAILQAAAQLYAAYITSGQVREGEEKKWMKRALKEAMSFAKTIHQYDDRSEEEADESAPSRAEAPPPSREDLEAEVASALAAPDQAPALKKKPEIPRKDRPEPIPVASDSDDDVDTDEEQDMRAVIDELSDFIGDEASDEGPGSGRKE